MPREPPTFLTLPLELRLEIYTHLLVLPPPPPPEKQQTIYRCSYAYLPSSHKGNPQPDNPTLQPQILAVNRQTNAEATPLLYGRNTFSAHPTDPTRPPTLYHPCYPSFSSRPIIPAALHLNHQQPRHPKHHLIKKWHLRLRLDTPLPTPTAIPPPLPNPASSTIITTTPSTTTHPSPPNPPHAHAHAHAQRSSNTTTITKASWTKQTITSSFSHSDTLTLHLWSNTPPFLGGIGADALRQFESVRGVRHVRVTGLVLPGFERYVSWLVGRMMSPPKGSWATRGEGERDGVGTGKIETERGKEGEGQELEEEKEEEEYVPADELEGKRLRGWV